MAHHFQLIPGGSVAFAKGWGMRVEIEELRRPPGARGLSGLVFIDGGSSPQPITKTDAQQRLADPERGLAVAQLRRHPGAVRRDSSARRARSAR